MSASAIACTPAVAIVITTCTRNCGGERGSGGVGVGSGGAGAGSRGVDVGCGMLAGAMVSATACAPAITSPFARARVGAMARRGAGEARWTRAKAGKGAKRERGQKRIRVLADTGSPDPKWERGTDIYVRDP